MRKKVLVISAIFFFVSGLTFTAFWLSTYQSLIVPLDSKVGSFSSDRTNVYINGKKFGLLSFDINGNNVYMVYIYAGNDTSNPTIFSMDGLTALRERTFNPSELERILYYLPKTNIYQIYIVQTSIENTFFEYETVNYTIQTYQTTDPFLFYSGLPLGISLIITSIAIFLIIVNYRTNLRIEGKKALKN
ncbi:MAG: hypothetical protein ACTSQI_19020 [Candidatus Helarchaeota archaeon]